MVLLGPQHQARQKNNTHRGYFSPQAEVPAEVYMAIYQPTTQDAESSCTGF